MKNMVAVISENTLIPISLVIVVIGGAMWLSSMSFSVDANADGLRELSVETTETRTMLYEKLNAIDQRLSRIEGKLNK